MFYSDMFHILFPRLCGMLGSGCESSSLTQCTALLIFAVSLSNVKPVFAMVTQGNSQHN